VAEVLEEGVQNDVLNALLEEYRKPVRISDPLLGEFELNKDFGMFEGTIDWLGKEIFVSLEVNIDYKAGWTKAMKALRVLFEEQRKRDSEFRDFAADELTALANDWSQDENLISKEDFIDKISLSSLSLTSGGKFIAYYDDGDMFYGHAVTVYGSLKKGLEAANIEG
jgi:hypothetical protein